ncbi:hypothetical protein ACV36O_30390, partial [Pseudomonas aeruginosa]
AFTLYNAIDAETMEVAWQVIVDGNLDNTDMDYSGRFAASTCYNSEKAVDHRHLRVAEGDEALRLDLGLDARDVEHHHPVALVAPHAAE